METILIVDDNRDMQFTISNILKDQGYETITAGDGERAIKEVKTKSPNLVLLDIKLPGMDGMKILEELKQIDKDVIIIMLTAFGAVKDAVRAMRLGAFDYISKPFDNEELVLIIKKALQTQYLSREVEVLKRRLSEKLVIDEVMGNSPAIKQVLKQVEIIAPTSMTVIIQGESGTGKELIAQMIHQKSLRKVKPFIAIDCGAIPESLMESELFGYEKGAFTGADSPKEGKFEVAHQGSLFLDEVANLSQGMQAKLLRVIQERKLQHLGGKRDISIDVRIIVASKTNLSEGTRCGHFRDDLFHRLNEFHINLPLLKERREDIPALVKYFLEEANQELNKNVKSISSQTMKFLLDYPWPGNVRELKNVIKRAVLLSDAETILPEYISVNHTPQDPTLTKSDTFELKEDSSLEALSEDFERKLIKAALQKSGGNRNEAARCLKINRKALYRKMKSLGLD